MIDNIRNMEETKATKITKDDILKIVSHHTLNVGRQRTLEDLADLENKTVDKLFDLLNTSRVEDAHPKYTTLRI